MNNESLCRDSKSNLPATTEENWASTGRIKQTWTCVNADCLRIWSSIMQDELQTDMTTYTERVSDGSQTAWWADTGRWWNHCVSLCWFCLIILSWCLSSCSSPVSGGWVVLDPPLFCPQTSPSDLFPGPAGPAAPFLSHWPSGRTKTLDIGAREAFRFFIFLQLFPCNQ